MKLKLLSGLVREIKAHEVFIGCVLILYIITNFKMPVSVTNVLNHVVLKALILIIGVGLLMKMKNVMGLLCLVACYELVKRTSEDSKPLVGYLPLQDKQDSRKARKRVFKKTLEEEIVQKMVPLVKKTNILSKGAKPVLNNTHNASDL